MYYYIFDVKKCKKRAQVEEIKTYLQGLGISGEFTYPTAAQSAEELVDLGLSKKYSTFVAIGDEEIANAVARRLLGRKEVFGVIPLEASSDLSKLIGADDWKEACNSLRFRKVQEIYLGQTASGAVFLTSAKLDVLTPIDITLEFKDYIVQSKVKELKIAIFSPDLKKIGPDYLDVILTSVDPKESGVLSTFASLIGLKSTKKDDQFSIFRARSLRIFAKTPIQILSAGKMIAKTPQLIESTDDKIRIITSKNALKYF